MALPVTRRMRARRWIGAFLWLLVGLVLTATIGVYAFMRASLPSLPRTIRPSVRSTLSAARTSAAKAEQAAAKLRSKQQPAPTLVLASR